MLKIVIQPLSDGYSPILTPQDLSYIDSLRSEKRKAESRSWRAALRERLSEMGYADEAAREIRYNEVGAPYMVDSEIHFSVSHSSKFVAVIISDTRCAIDIESCERDFLRVARRYVTEEEAKFNSGTTPLLPLIWSAKEALYKFSGRSGLDFLSDICVTAINPEAKSLEAKICDEPTPALHYEQHENHIVVYI